MRAQEAVGPEEHAPDVRAVLTVRDGDTWIASVWTREKLTRNETVELLLDVITQLRRPAVDD